MSTLNGKEAPPIKPSILEASPEEQAAWAVRFRASVEAFGDGIPEEEMTDEELDAFIREEIDADRAEPRELEEKRLVVAA